jgi:hypothetical protein
MLAMQYIRDPCESTREYSSPEPMLTMKQFGVPGLCSPCLQVSFNAWPSAVGTRNENIESLVLFLMPGEPSEP